MQNFKDFLHYCWLFFGSLGLFVLSVSPIVLLTILEAYYVTSGEEVNLFVFYSPYFILSVVAFIVGLFWYKKRSQDKEMIIFFVVFNSMPVILAMAAIPVIIYGAFVHWLNLLVGGFSLPVNFLFFGGIGVALFFVAFFYAMGIGSCVWDRAVCRFATVEA